MLTQVGINNIETFGNSSSQPLSPAGTWGTYVFKNKL